MNLHFLTYKRVLLKAADFATTNHFSHRSAHC